MAPLLVGRGRASMLGMTLYVVPFAPWHECVSEYLYYALDPGDAVEIWPAGKLLEKLPEGCVVAAPHLLGSRAQLLPRSQRCYESENLFAGSAAAQANLALRAARPDLRWEHYSPWQAAHYGDVAKPPKLPQLRARVAPPPGAPVLFIGSLNDRRAQMLGQLPRDRLRVIGTGAPLWGAALQTELARAALVLNLRYYDRPSEGARVGLPETFRICFALDAGCPVLSEFGLDPLATDGLTEGFYADLPALARALLNEHDRDGRVS